MLKMSFTFIYEELYFRKYLQNYLLLFLFILTKSYKLQL